MEQLLYIIWNDGNRIGIPIIDEQHRGIVATINSFHHFVRQGHGTDVIALVMKILEQYSLLHFTVEEALMREAGYPDLEAHIDMHRRLLERTRRIAAAPHRDEEVEVSLRFLKDWWLGHIGSEDRKYVPTVLRR